MNKQQLANKIWESANKMRSKIEANEYKDYILGFIFYKYLSDKEIEFLKENDFSDEDIRELIEEEYDGEEVKFEDTNQSYCQCNIGYFIEYKNLFSTWVEMGKDFDISNVTDALSAFNRLISPTHKKVFENIFQTLETGLTKLGESSGARTKAISGLLQLIKDIPMDGKQDYDVLGFIYEYLISMFAANAGKKAGEFYTPHEVSLLMSEIVANHLKGKEEIKIYDPTSGSGSLLINIGHSVAKYIADDNNIKYYAQELKENTYNLTRMNLVMRGIKPDNIVTRNGDTLEEDWPYFDENDPVNTYNPLYVDAVVSNPPYSQAWDPSDKEHDPRYTRFGLAPKGKADYAFLLHDLFHIRPDGIMTIVLPHGVLFRGGEEGTIRKNLIENNHIDTIIGLPANIFFGTGIPTIIMVLKQHRENTDILIVDASKGFIKDGKNNKLRASDIKQISDTVINRENIEGYSRVVNREEIRANDYNLNIPRYVDSSENTESWDIYASMFGGIPINELDDLKDYWIAFPELRNALFTKEDIPYVELITQDISSTIREHSDIRKFEENFATAFDNFSDYLKSELLEKIKDIVIAKEKNILSENIFKRLKSIPLIDKYEAYQFLHDEWEKISADIEVLQTEGFEVAKKVNPNLITKKKDGKDEEVQEGWSGHIIPFDLVQKVFLVDESNAVKEKENRLAEIPSEYEEIIESMTEEEKDTEVLNEANDAFISKEVSKKIKELKLEEKTQEVVAFISKLEMVERLQREEKELKTKIKNEVVKLQMITKEKIEKLSDEEVYMLLEKKWVDPLITSLHKLPDRIIDELIDKIQGIKKKYETTYFEIEEQIRETKQLLCSMIDEMEGNEFDMKGLSEFKSLLLGE
ncbi:type I restriction enzyme M protein [Fusobacterium sp. PH5-7]|uniref:type I restriction-modification system subunit M n=1 Tax=Fusobacterium sp. PH5-7 TaxID=2940528 RepID=UPI0024757611|nr:type I restriction-modification system subunit M [Fusobacterium sp. PH5-7]MDH6456394.1 type I restriction enzyme M protein [Fusobacterium sp. PH5-7]